MVVTAVVVEGGVVVVVVVVEAVFLSLKEGSKTGEDEVGLLWTRNGEGGLLLRLNKFFLLSPFCCSPRLTLLEVEEEEEAAGLGSLGLKKNGRSFLVGLLNSPVNLFLGEGVVAVAVVVVVVVGSSCSWPVADDAKSNANNRSSTRRSWGHLCGDIMVIAPKKKIDSECINQTAKGSS